jgi:hypothetical protein
MGSELQVLGGALTFPRIFFGGVVWTKSDWGKKRVSK